MQAQKTKHTRNRSTMYNRLLHIRVTSLRYDLREMNHPLSQGNGPTAFYVTALFWSNDTIRAAFCQILPPNRAAFPMPQARAHKVEDFHLDGPFPS